MYITVGMAREYAFAAVAKVAVRMKVRKKIDAPGRLVARRVGTLSAVLPRLPRALMRPDEMVTIIKP